MSSNLEAPAKTPRWALGLGFIFIAAATSLITTSPFLEKAFGLDDKDEEITKLTGQVELCNETLETVSSSLNDLKKKVITLEEERDLLLDEVEELKIKLDFSEEGHAKLEKDLETKKARIKELEALLIKIAEEKQGRV